MNIFIKVLFYVFVSIFAITAIVTILGVIKWVNIEHEYLIKLFYVVLVEIAGCIVAFFKSKVLKIEKIKLRFDIEDEYDIHSVAKFGYTAKLINQDDNNKETILKGRLYHDNDGLCSDVEITNYKQTLYVTIDINGKKYRGAEWLDARRIKLN